MQTIYGVLRNPTTLEVVAGLMPKISFTDAGALVVHLSGTDPSGLPAGLRVTTLANIPLADFVGLEVAAQKYLFDSATSESILAQVVDIDGVTAATFLAEPSAAALFASDGTNVIPVTLVTNAGIPEANFKGVPVFAVQAKGNETDFVHVPLNGNTPTTASNVSVTAASTLMCSGTQNRTSIFLQNNGDFDVWCIWGAGPAVVGTGFKLAAGGWISFSNESCPSQALRGIGDGGTSAVYVQETSVEAH